jgi:dolichol-phosphate mannosyltransferase
MKRVLVTGATGFVGANLAHRLIRDGHEVHLIVRPSSSSFRLPHLQFGAQVHFVDLCNADDVMQVVASVRPDWIFHLAVYGAYTWQNDPLAMVQANVVGTANLVEACLKAGFEGFVNTGSSSEYGLKSHAPKEGEDCIPNSYYSVTKMAATQYCQYAAESHQAHMPTLRLYSVYGPWEEPNRFIPSLIVHALDGKLPPLVAPDTARDFIYVDDVVEAYLNAVAKQTPEYGAIYNIGSSKQTTIRQAVDTARELFGVSMEPDWGSMASHHWDTSTWVSDTRKVESTLGWMPRLSLADGFKATAAWLQQDKKILAHYRERVFASAQLNALAK